MTEKHPKCGNSFEKQYPVEFGKYIKVMKIVFFCYKSCQCLDPRWRSTG